MKSQKLGGLVLMAFISQFSQAQDLPQSMGALGDSITASAFAAYPRQDARRFENQFALFVGAMTALAGRVFQKKKYYGIESPELSWATGMDPTLRVISHAKRLKFLNPKLKIFNAAISGGDSATVDDEEIESLRKWSRKNLHQEFPDYITLLIGPNDVCQKQGTAMTTEADFDERIRHTVDTIVAGHKNTKILISAIPNIAALRDIAKNAPAFAGPNMDTCLKVWEKIPFCPNIQLNEDRTEQFQRVSSFNAILKSIAFDANQINGGDRVRVADSIYRYNFTPDDIAVDCFHPNHFAHRRLADMTFEESWWSRQWNEVRPIAMEQFENQRRAKQKAQQRPH